MADNNYNIAPVLNPLTGETFEQGDIRNFQEENLSAAIPEFNFQRPEKDKYTPQGIDLTRNEGQTVDMTGIDPRTGEPIGTYTEDEIYQAQADSLSSITLSMEAIPLADSLTMSQFDIDIEANPEVKELHGDISQLMMDKMLAARYTAEINRLNKEKFATDDPSYQIEIDGYKKKLQAIADNQYLEAPDYGILGEVAKATAQFGGQLSKSGKHVGLSATSGAVTGTMVGGLPGALYGGLVGAGAGCSLTSKSR